MTLTNLGDLIDRTRNQDRLALIDARQKNDVHLYSYAELDALAGGVARHLVARGLPRGARVAILSANRAEYVAVYCGVMRAGMVAVPLNLKMPVETIHYMLDDSRVALAFVDAARAATVPAGIATVDFDDTGANGFAALIEPAPFATVQVEAHEIAQILYTSGSTGRPKGVPLSHGGQLWSVETKTKHAPDSNECHIVAQPLFHMNGLFATKIAMKCGATLVIQPGFNARDYLWALSEFRVTAIAAVPTMLARVIREMNADDLPHLSALRAITLASAPISDTMYARIQAAFPQAELRISYGTTEAGATPFMHRADAGTPPLALGIPAPGSEVKLTGGDSPDEGVLHMRNPAVMTGYLNLPEKTAKVLDDGWYNSGDLMRRDENGFYYFVGRADDMFVCSGENIYPVEVETMLETHPSIAQAIVVPLADEERAHIPVAFVVTRPGMALTYDDVKRYSLSNAPTYHHPRRIEFTPELPLAGTNKIDRAALVRRAKDLEVQGGWSI
jgi:long-chain acyl-CoA synthetase